MKTILHGWLLRNGVDLIRDYLADERMTIFIAKRKWKMGDGRKAHRVKITVEDVKKGKRK